MKSGMIRFCVRFGGDEVEIDDRETGLVAVRHGFA